VSAATCWIRPLRDGRVELFARAQDEATIGVAGSFAVAIGLLRRFETQHGTVGHPFVQAQRGRRDETWHRNMAWLAHTVDRHWKDAA
jgi:hypothetical protein